MTKSEAMALIRKAQENINSVSPEELREAIKIVGSFSPQG